MQRSLVGMAMILACSVLTSTAQAQMCGDADGNGQVTVTDGVNVLRAAAGLPGDCPVARCDVDGNGNVTVTDGVNVLRAAAGLETNLACSIDWQLQNATFDDGGTLSGTFNFDATTFLSTDWNIMASGGNTVTFPPFVYTPTNSYFCGASSANGGSDTLVCFMSRSSDMRTVGLYFTRSLADPNGPHAITFFVSPFGSTNPSSECFNCAPFRVVTSGDVEIAPTQ